MINFLRKNRKQFLTEDRFIKYLLYAIGEIALIVIGIMIALQLNNWYTENQNSRKETLALLDISSGLLFDLDDLRLNIIAITRRHEGANYLYPHSNLIFSHLFLY